MRYLLIIISLNYILFATTIEDRVETKDNITNKSFQEDILVKFKDIPKLRNIETKMQDVEISGEIVIRHSF